MTQHEDSNRSDLTPAPQAPLGRPIPGSVASRVAGPTLAAMLAACGMSHPGAGDAGLVPDAPISSPGDAGPGADPDAPVPVAFCEQACAARMTDGCIAEADCRGYCEAEAAGWSEPVRDAFATCIAENPLCFETTENCMLAALHPPPSLHPLRVRGSGLAELEGRTVRVWTDPDRVPMVRAEARIVDGGFEVDLGRSVAAAMGDETLLLAYVDVDGDGRCSSSADLTAALYGTWNGDLVAPAFEVQVSPPLADPDFVCSIAP